MRTQHFHEKGIFAIMKRSKYSYHHPKPLTADHRLPPPPIGHPPPPPSRGYFWKFIKYSQKFNLHIKHSKNIIPVKVISKNTIPKNMKIYSICQTHLELGGKWWGWWQCWRGQWGKFDVGGKFWFCRTKSCCSRIK